MLKNSALRVGLLWALFFSAAASAEVIKVAVSQTPLNTPFFVAEKLGYFRDEGLDVAITDCAGGNVCLKLLFEGKVQLATASDLPIMFRSFERQDFYLLASFATSPNNVKLIARKSAGIKTIKDLKGKRVGIIKGSASQYFLDLASLSQGIDPRDLKTVHLDLTQLDQAAADAQIVAFALWDPFALKLNRLLGNDAVRLTSPNLYSLNFNLVALRSSMNLAEDDQFKFLRALDKAIRFIKADPAKAKEVLVTRLQSTAADVEAFWPDYHFNLSLNQSLISILESEASWALREKLVKAETQPNYLDYVEVGPLKRLRATAVTLIK